MQNFSSDETAASGEIKRFLHKQSALSLSDPSQIVFRVTISDCDGQKTTQNKINTFFECSFDSQGCP